VRRPTYFKPTNDALIPALEATSVAVMAPAPGAHTMWRAWLGANITHGLGLLVCALLLLAIAVHDYALVSDIPGVRLLSIPVALTYVLIAPALLVPARDRHGEGRAHLLRHRRNRLDGSQCCCPMKEASAAEAPTAAAPDDERQRRLRPVPRGSRLREKRYSRARRRVT
jgi:hypothetical protein